ncbi:hypothetical protein AVEN_2842-1 [Araneus ventricosus]|uniref:Uncharacterized protein n=1 Tax=Araneus ventricosus TaxID=182803 RepID=A0A4Y2DT14_ARAVE|nr:hypothetical protein AVEN_2842-1 [Araneus ventricosus]
MPVNEIGIRWRIKFYSTKLKQSEPIFLLKSDGLLALGCAVRVGQHCDQQIFRMSELTVSLNYEIYFAFQFCVQIYSCSDEFEQVSCSIFRVLTNFDTKPEFSEDYIKTYKRRIRLA